MRIVNSSECRFGEKEEETAEQLVGECEVSCPKRLRPLQNIWSIPPQNKRRHWGSEILRDTLNEQINPNISSEIFCTKLVTIVSQLLVYC